MPTLTRRRMQDVHQEAWLIFYGDIRVGTIAERAGVPIEVDQWGWLLGFYPRSDQPGQIRSGTAATFELAREAFELEWRDYLPTCLPAYLHRGGLPRVPPAPGQGSMEACDVGRPCVATDADL